MKKMIVVGMVFAMLGCSGGEGVTTSSPITQEETVAGTGGGLGETFVAVDEGGDEVGTDGKTTLNAGKLGDGRFDYTNSGQTNKTAFVKYTAPGDPARDARIPYELIEVQPGANPTSSAPESYLYSIFEPEASCEEQKFNEVFQIDTGLYSRGQESVHLTAYASYRVKITYPASPEGFWEEGESKESEHEITKGEWGETQQGEEGCFQAREVKETWTTTPTEVNSCNRETRDGEVEQHEEVTQETQAVECPCVEEWSYDHSEEGEEDFIYGQWSEIQGREEGCFSSRTVVRHYILSHYEINSCTQEVRLRNTQEVYFGLPNEEKAVECPCAAADFWDQSEEHNKNNIKFNVHVRGDGDFALYLYAASSYSEYERDDPDYQKDSDSKKIECKGQGELKVSYNWKDHSSDWWWAVLKVNGLVVWKSPAVKHD